jgi:hypothetical protein
MKVLFRTLAALAGCFAALAGYFAATTYLRDPSTIPGLWLTTALISLTWAWLFGTISRRFK